MPTQIKLKRGLAANLTALTLQAGEPAFVTDTGKLYIGDGTNKVLVNPVNKPIGIDTSKSYTKVKVNEFGQVISLADLATSDLPNIPASNISGLGTAALANIGTSSGNIPVLDVSGKLDTTVIPSIAITDTFVVSSQTAMLDLKAEVGDIAIRTDTNENYILKSSPASTLANWVKLLVPIDSVTSVNGKTGSVVLLPTDLLMTGYVKAITYSEIKVTDDISTSIGKLEKNFDNFAPLASPALTGTPTSTTPASNDNSTKIATTAYVANSLVTYAPLTSPTFTGVPTSTTPVSGDNSTKIATTAYVQGNLAVIDGGTF